MFKIENNMCILDRALRLIFGIVIVVLSRPFLDIVPGGFLSYFCLVFGVINVLSSLFSWCFMYSLIGLSSRKEDDN